MKIGLQKLVLVYCCCLLAACANVADVSPGAIATNVPVLPAFADKFGTRPSLPTPETVQQLSPDQAERFLTYFNLPQNQSLKPYTRVFNYLFENTLALEYDARTYTAAQTLELKRGNCLSLALLTTALAKLANLQINYQLVEAGPVFVLAGDLVNREVHVKSVLSEYKEVRLDDFNSLFPDRVVIDYFVAERSRFISNISRRDFDAMYYLNMAGEALEAGDDVQAFWLTREALELNPANPNALNIMAVVHRRMNEFAKAEEIYLFALQHADNKLAILKNYHVLLTLQGRRAEADAVQTRLDTMNDPSPFRWYALAQESYKMQDYDAAIRYFKKTLEIAPYLHEAYLGKALSFYRMGRSRDAEEALGMAIENADRSTTRSLYEAKLLALAGT